MARGFFAEMVLFVGMTCSPVVSCGFFLLFFSELLLFGRGRHEPLAVLVGLQDLSLPCLALQSFASVQLLQIYAT